MKKKDVSEKIKASFHLLCGGILTSLLLVILSSGLITSIDSYTIVYIISIIQFQQLGVTFAKMGMDNLSFIIAIDREKEKLDYFYYIRKYSLAISFAFCIVLFFLTDAKTALIVFAAVIIDTFSVVKTMELNGRKMFAVTNISNLLKTPLFLIVAVTASLLFDADRDIILTSFFVACVLRFLYLLRYDKRDGFDKVREESQIPLAIQQTLNYGLFKADQYIVLIPLILLTFTDSLFQNKVLFMTRLPEIISGVLTGLSALYLPYITLEKVRKYGLKFLIIYLPAGFILAFVGVFIYTYFWKYDSGIPYAVIIGYALFIILILPVNIVSFLLLRIKKYWALIRILIVSLSVTAAITVFTGITVSFQFVIPYIVPFQLFLFLVTGLFYIKKELK